MEHPPSSAPSTSERPDYEGLAAWSEKTDKIDERPTIPETKVSASHALSTSKEDVDDRVKELRTKIQQAGDGGEKEKTNTSNEQVADFVLSRCRVAESILDNYYAELRARFNNIPPDERNSLNSRYSRLIAGRNRYNPHEFRAGRMVLDDNVKAELQRIENEASELLASVKRFPESEQKQDLESAGNFTQSFPHEEKRQETMTAEFSVGGNRFFSDIDDALREMEIIAKPYRIEVTGNKPEDAKKGMLNKSYNVSLRGDVDSMKLFSDDLKTFRDGSFASIARKLADTITERR